ncbi:MAG: thiamine diphosphokinase [Candidatus Limnocylindrales bacterium]
MTDIDVAVVVAGGEIPDRLALDGAWPGWNAGHALVVAADGGADGAAALALTVDILVGDLDSIDARHLATLQAAGVTVEAWPRDKDASDAELALRSALRHDPRRIVLLGAAGGARLDHALANVALLGLADLRGRDVTILDAASRIRLVAGPADAELVGRVGDLVSLLPTGFDVDGIRTQGLAYPLSDETLLVGSSRGLSNVRTATTAHLHVGAGRLLVIEVVAQPEVQP